MTQHPITETATPLIEWSDQAFALGLTSMDTTHREFVVLVNALAHADDADFGQCLTRLHQHTRAHFAREDALMDQTRFPAATEHKAEHRRVLAELAQLQRRVDKGVISFARSYVRERLPEWFHLHLATMDSALAAHLRDYPQAAASA